MSTMSSGAEDATGWTQWRGPHRTGWVDAQPWPDRLTDASLKPLWRIEAGPSYSGPVMTETLVFTTETVDKTDEMVIAVERATGKTRWRTGWHGAMKVPFFARSNGSWIRSTPATDGERLYVAGMRDVLTCLDVETGTKIWRRDFVADTGSKLPTFGFVCSPLIDGSNVFVQAGGAVVCLDKYTGKTHWEAMADGGGMNGSAFSSPIIGVLGGVRQFIVQTRTTLAGLDLASGDVLWSRDIPAYRGMNILTPTLYGDSIFTSSYRNGAWRLAVNKSENAFSVSDVWGSTTKAYMSSPVMHGDHLYLFLQLGRFACMDLKTGERTWTSNKPEGKYASLVLQGDRVLALTASGDLVMFRANPKAWEPLGRTRISENDSWAHLAVDGNTLYVRELNALAAYQWNTDTP